MMLIIMLEAFLTGHKGDLIHCLTNSRRHTGRKQNLKCRNPSRGVFHIVWWWNLCNFVQRKQLADNWTLKALLSRAACIVSTRDGINSGSPWTTLMKSWLKQEALRRKGGQLQVPLLSQPLSWQKFPGNLHSRRIIGNLIDQCWLWEILNVLSLIFLTVLGKLGPTPGPNLSGAQFA